MAVPGTRSAGADDGGIGLLGFDHDVGFDARVIPVAVTPRSASRRAQQAGKRSAARLGAVHLQSNTRADSVVCQAASVCSVGSTSTIKDRPRCRIVVDPARLKALGTSVVASEVELLLIRLDLRRSAPVLWHQKWQRFSENFGTSRLWTSCVI